ncbi:MAG: hypothetical protein ACOH12_05350 [Parvibaculaceae bacterium]
MSRRTVKNLTITLLFSTAMLIGGCAGRSEYADDPLYASGYTDGCGTGTGFNPSDKSSVLRDPDGWAQSKAYRVGWKKGFNACRPTNKGTTSDYPADARGRGNGPSGY